MNIISNNCAGGFLYNIFQRKFTNPFIWAAIDFDSLIQLINNYAEINFYNIRPFEFHDLHKCSKLVVDNRLLIDYGIHFRYAKKNSISYKKHVIHRNDLYPYLALKYLERLGRMKKLNEDPVFVIFYDQYHKKDAERLKQNIGQINTSYDVYIFTDIDIMPHKENIHIFNIGNIDIKIEDMIQNYSIDFWKNVCKIDDNKEYSYNIRSFEHTV